VEDLTEGHIGDERHRSKARAQRAQRREAVLYVGIRAGDQVEVRRNGLQLWHRLAQKRLPRLGPGARSHGVVDAGQISRYDVGWNIASGHPVVVHNVGVMLDKAANSPLAPVYDHAAVTRLGRRRQMRAHHITVGAVGHSGAVRGIAGG
jgi:hypothetical protein